MDEQEKQSLQALYQAQIAATSRADRQKLRQSRQHALQAADAEAPAWLRWAWLPAGAMASLLVVLLWPGTEMAQPEAELAAVDDMEILLDEQDLAFYAELEFYLWLEEKGDNDVL